MCIRIYIFNFKKKQKKQTRKQTKATAIIRNQKAKETKEKKKNFHGKSNKIRCYRLRICSVYF